MPTNDSSSCCEDSAFWEGVARRLARELAEKNRPGQPEHMIAAEVDATLCGFVIEVAG